MIPPKIRKLDIIIRRLIFSSRKIIPPMAAITGTLN
jgi:hypothetical protein